MKSPKSKNSVAMCSPRSKLGPDFNNEHEVRSQQQDYELQSQR